MRRVLLVAALLAAAGPAARAQNIPAGPGADLSSLVGQTIDVPFVVDMTARPEQLGAFAMRLSWNPAVLRYDAGLPGSFGAVTVSPDSIAQGIVRLAGANPSGAGALVTVAVARFTPLIADTTTIGVSVTELFAAGTFADLLPFATVSSGLFCPARGRYGDVDRDGSANSRDALIALSNAVGLDVSQFDIGLGDVDADGNANARDALIILSAAVGLDVSAYRVLAIAGGSCASGPPVTFTVVPGTIGDVVIGQQIQFEARATDGSGVPQAVPDAAWLVSDPNRMGILASGQALARDTGLVDVIAVRGGRDTARVIVHVVARRSTHFVSAAATGATNRLGTAALPFADLGELGVAVRQGDTVRMRPGRYPGSALYGAAVLIGERSGPATAVIAGSGEPVGLNVFGTGITEIHDIGIEGFQTGLRISSADTVLVDSLRVLANGPGGCYQAGIEVFSAWLLRVRRSQIVGDGINGCADGIGVYGAAGVVEVDQTTLTDLGGSGISSGGTDSLVVRRVRINDTDNSGIEVWAGSGGGGAPPARGPAPMRGPVAPPASVALVVEDTRIERVGGSALSLDEIRSAYVARSVLDARPYGDGIDIDGGGSARTGYIKLASDTIRTDDAYWMDASGLDSIVIDSTRVVGTYGGYFDDIGLVRVTTSSFNDVTYGTAFYLYGYSSSSRTLAFDSVTITGAASCSQCAEGVYADGYRGAFNRVRFDNLDEGISIYGDSAVSVTNAVFTDIYQGIYASSGAAQPPRLKVSRVTMTGAYYAIWSYNRVTVVDTATLTGSVNDYVGINAEGSGADTVRFSTITGYQYGASLEGAPAYAANNTVNYPGYNAFYVYSGGGTPADSAVLLNNTVTCDAYGAQNAGMVDAYYSNMRLEGNTVAGCNWGIYISSGAAGLSARVRNNTVSLSPAADYPGILVGGPYRTEVVGNVITGGAPYADGSIYVSGAARTRVDSNTVQQPQVWGIRLESVDSVEVRGNLVEDVTTPFCCFTNPGGIALYGSMRYLARIAGNTVRRAHGAGIAINQTDSTTVFVDSNSVSGSDTMAVRMQSGRLWMRHNNIRNNARNGLEFTLGAGGHEVHDNAFKGNGRYAIENAQGAIVNADGNWWGANAEPPGGPGADSARGIVDNAPLPAEPANLTPLAPPVIRPTAVLAAAGMTSVPSGIAAPAVGAPRAARPAAPERQARASESQRRSAPGMQAQVRAARMAVAAERSRELAARRAAAATQRAALDAQRAAADSTRTARRAEIERRKEARR